MKAAIHGGSLSSTLSSPTVSRSVYRYAQPHLGFAGSSGLSIGAIRAVNREGRGYVFPWDEKPYDILPNGKRVYLDEEDVVMFLDPPRDLIPLDPSSYNPAAYLWKKIEEIPEERRHSLLQLLNPRLISRAWEIASARYEDPKLAQKTASKLLSTGDTEVSLEFYNCRTSGGPLPISWINFFKKAVFCSSSGKMYGRIIGSPLVAKFADPFSPLYFKVTQTREVMATEEPCDLAYEFGDGLLGINDYPQGFPRPVKHRYPFNDHIVIYIRNIGPGVCVGKAWQEGRELQQVPRKFCNEILMVKQYHQ